MPYPTPECLLCVWEEHTLLALINISRVHLHHSLMHVTSVIVLPSGRLPVYWVPRVSPRLPRDVMKKATLTSYTRGAMLVCLGLGTRHLSRQYCTPYWPYDLLSLLISYKIDVVCEGLFILNVVVCKIIFWFRINFFPSLAFL